MKEGSIGWYVQKMVFPKEMKSPKKSCGRAAENLSGRVDEINRLRQTQTIPHPLRNRCERLNTNDSE